MELEPIRKAAKGMYNVLPLILGTVLLVGLISLIPRAFYSLVFNQNIFDTLIGAVIGSISAGNPVSSYILGGELISQGVSLVAVTAFLIAWVTVGIVQLPAESMILGRRFAIIRNVTSFLLSILASIIIIILL